MEKKCSFSSAVNLNKILSHYPLSHLAFLSLPPDLGSGLLTVYKLLEPFPGLPVPQKQSRGSKPHPLSSAPNKQQALKKQKKKKTKLNSLSFHQSTSLLSPVGPIWSAQNTVSFLPKRRIKLKQERTPGLSGGFLLKWYHRQLPGVHLST